MKIINRADRLVGDCPVVDPLTFLAGYMAVQTDPMLPGLGKAATGQTGMRV